MHGKLRKLTSEPLEVFAATAEEAVHFLSQMFQWHNLTLDNRPRLQVVGYDCVPALREPLREDVDEIHIVPAFFGGGGGNPFTQIFVGGALIVAGIATGGASFALAGALGTAMVGMGASMVLGGIFQFLSPAPERDSGIDGATDPEASNYLAAQGNTTKIGTRIAVGYGQYKVAGHYLHYDVDAKDVAI